MNENIKNKILELLLNDDQEESKDITWVKACDYYLKFVKVNRSIGTYEMNKNHMCTINKYFKILKINYLSQINNLLINEFISMKKQIGNKNATINKELGIIKRVIDYANEMELIKPSLSLTFPKLKETQPKIHIIEKNDIKRIVNYANRLKLQSRLIIYILISTGIRRTEITNIIISNIDLDNNSIYLEDTKTAKPRFIYFNDEIKAMILLQIKRNKTYLFEHNGNKITADSISSIVKRMKKDLNIECLSPHKFRHTFATHLIINGANIQETANLLGHSSYEMTKRYLHLNDKQLKLASQKYNPLNSIK